MIIDLVQLKNGVAHVLPIDETYTFTKEQLEDSGILELNQIHIFGHVTSPNLEQYYLEATLEGTMILPCSISLKPVSHFFSTKIEGNIEDLLEEIGESSKKIENSIDILPIIWENILMEIPMKIISKELDDVKLEGEGWKFVTEDTKTSVNPELEKLKDLFNEK